MQAARRELLPTHSPAEARVIPWLVSKHPSFVQKADFPLNLEMAKSSRISFIESGKSLLHLKKSNQFFFFFLIVTKPIA